MARPKPTCGFTGSHDCLGPNTNPNGNRQCIKADALNAARATGADGGLLAHDRDAKILAFYKTIQPNYKGVGNNGAVRGKIRADILVNKLTTDEPELSDTKFVLKFITSKGWIEAQPGTTSVIEPENQETSNYWGKYAATKHNAAYKAEQERKKRDNVESLKGGYDPKKHAPADPSDPDAYVPLWVRFAKRELVGFTCPITGWKESDWIQPINGGKIRLVGELTLDHKLARSKNGRTTDENTRMICSLANGKKGDRNKTDEEIRTNLTANYKVVEVPTDLLVVLTKYSLREYR